MSSRFEQYLKYLVNAGAVTPEQFDDDWEPVGSLIRKDMTDAKLIQVIEGRIYRVKMPAPVTGDA